SVKLDGHQAPAQAAGSAAGAAVQCQYSFKGIFQMRSMLLRSVGVAAFLLPATALAQSTGSIDFDDDVIIVTGSVARDVAGVIIPDTPKAKGVLTQEVIERQNPGQTILDTINTLPGVNFQNNDAYGSSGGTLNI